MTIRIAIIGKARSGKDTFCQLLKQNFLPHAVLIEAFANPIKQIVKVMYPSVPDQWLFGPSELRQNIIPNSNNTTVRQLTTDLGKMGRKMNENIWINSTLTKIQQQENFIHAAIISDCRFRNEFLELKKNNYYLIKLYRPDNDFKFDDISETDLDQTSDEEFDQIIYNGAGLEQLNMAAKAFCSRF